MRAKAAIRRPLEPMGSRLGGYDLPGGLPGDLPVQSRPQKYFRSCLTQITCISLAVSSHKKGRLAIVTNAGRDAVDASSVSTKALSFADGEVVWF
jgi:hypothetical protein